MPEKRALEKELLSLLLPEGLLDYFEVVSMKLKDKQYFIYLEEKNLHPERFKGEKLTSKGFYDEVTIQDFPVRGKPCYLKVKRRKWLNEDTGKNVSRDWHMVANGTRMTEEFALFLKRNSWISSL